MQRKFNRSLIILSLMFFVTSGYSQPFADIASLSYQSFSSTYVSAATVRNKTDNLFLNLFLPKQFKNGNALLIRLNGEYLNTTIWAANDPETKYASEMRSISLPLGFKFATGNKKWETIIIGIPKMTSTNYPAKNTDYQLGGIFLEQFISSPKLKIKAGLYYNYEAFGNFFVPLLGVDWKINDRIYLYGILPTNYKVEFNIMKQKLYAGLNFKSLTRSFGMGKEANFDYIRYDEMQVKMFVDYFVYKKVLLFAELGYTIGESPLQYSAGTHLPASITGRYSPVEPYLLFNVGFAYRVRLDFEKPAETSPVN